jgi:hypothetical protein
MKTKDEKLLFAANELEDLLNDLTAGVTAKDIEEAGGPIAFARQCAEGDCCCEEELPEDEEEDMPMGIHSDDSGTWCLRCQGLTVIDVLEGRDAGETVFDERGGHAIPKNREPS